MERARSFVDCCLASAVGGGIDPVSKESREVDVEVDCYAAPGSLNIYIELPPTDSVSVLFWPAFRNDDAPLAIGLDSYADPRPMSIGHGLTHEYRSGSKDDRPFIRRIPMYSPLSRPYPTLAVAAVVPGVGPIVSQRLCCNVEDRGYCPPKF
jgi:hypothetical protein